MQIGVKVLGQLLVIKKGGLMNAQRNLATHFFVNFRRGSLTSLPSHGMEPSTGILGGPSGNFTYKCSNIEQHEKHSTQCFASKRIIIIIIIINLFFPKKYKFCV